LSRGLGNSSESDEESRKIQMANQVANKLRNADIKFSRQSVVSGFAPDFLVSLPDGRQAILEIKAWDPLKKNVDRAARQARYYTAATGVDATYVVLPGLGKGLPKRGVVGERYLVES